MGLFEENPLLMVPFVFAVVLAYDGAKWLLARAIRSGRSQRGGVMGGNYEFADSHEQKILP